jgi:hypothetical protein
MLSPTELAADLLLARLLVPTKRPPAPKQVRTSLEKFFGQPVTDEQFQEWIGQLRAAGLLTDKRLVLTQAGRERALTFLGARDLPPGCDWRAVQARYLVPRALGLDPETARMEKRIDTWEKLAALLLKRKFNLPVGTGPSLGNVLQALACQQLGFPDETTLDDVKNIVLNRMLSTDEPLSPSQLRNSFPRVLLGAKDSGIRAFREVALRGWADDGSRSGESTTVQPAPDETPPSEFDLAAFANTVNAAARDCLDGRFGDNKVFINHVWRRLADEPSLGGLDLERFKQRLIEAHRSNLLTLSRADLVSVMNPEDVRTSETAYLNGLFHFVLIEKEQP